MDVYRRMLLVASLEVSIGCSSSIPGARSEHNSCGPGGRQRPLDIVATTRSANGDVWDWIPAESQTGGRPLATPPPMPDMPGAVDAGTQASNQGVPAVPQGPPGTVPMLRPRAGVHCECLDGYVLLPDGRCEDLEERCAGPGEFASAKVFTQCCPGLVPATPAGDGSCRDDMSHARVCLRCGDGVCGAGEKPCNCPNDCR